MGWSKEELEKLKMSERERMRKRRGFWTKVTTANTTVVIRAKKIMK